ncbi:helix-turn-helix domain-containing protein [Fodinibius salsisoli]|uniref:Helix-turn-helix transcriptional regulator n=1 Tax=Fodinibius salsisoli TaxID=2820877 RepID=A0ABT3PPF2_9BACT|nr:AraC family transcriptional regulator [Fodinibius salsisoli]MCW9707719.1 helix-turn-helix transcriptional regulator [Fodinibius salsisoli]
MSEQRSLIKPHFLNLSTTKNSLHGLIAERNIEQPKEEYRDLSIEPDKHILVLHNNHQNELEWKINGNRKKERFRLSDLIINPAGLNANPHWETDVELLVLAINPTFIQFVAEEMNCPARVGLFPRFKFRDKFLDLMTRKLVNEFEHKPKPDLVYAESLTYALVSHLIRKYSRDGNHKQPIQKNGLPPVQLSRIIDYINEHIGKNLTLEGLAQIADFSPSHFITLFKNATGITPHQYILKRKIAFAKDQLINTDHSISAVALNTGFADQSHLTRTMRKHTGLTPGEIRNS